MGTLTPYGLFELDLEARRSGKGRDCSFRMRVYCTFPPVAPKPTQRLGGHSQVGQECGVSYPGWVPHLARATGNTIYLENDGRLEHAQQMAGHESPRTTKLYDRTKDEITLSEVERIRL
jgi:hypothetical protein